MQKQVAQKFLFLNPIKIIVLSSVLSQVMRPCCLSKADVPPETKPPPFNMQTASRQPNASLTQDRKIQYMQLS
jgi:hypothetical protein